MKRNSKSEMAALVAAGLAHETFHHQTLGHFNITLLRQRLAVAKTKPTIHRCDFGDMRMADGLGFDAYSYLIANREIDYERAATLTDEQLREPVIMALCPAGTNGEEETHLLIDGIHRLVGRKMRGKRFLRYYLVPLAAVPIVDPMMFEQCSVPWGDKELVPGVGLVDRK